MEPQSKKNQVKHGKNGSIVPPLLPQVLKSIHKICLHSA